jgi:hypothetical protein
VGSHGADAFSGHGPLILLLAPNNLACHQSPSHGRLKASVDSRTYERRGAMAKKGTATAKLNVLLLKSTFTDFDDALKDDHSLTRVPLKKVIGDASALYVKTPHQNPPSWAKFLTPVATTQLQLANASSSAVLFVKVKTRVFAFCFGHGRTELKPEASVNGFGLKVALNRVDPAKLRSVDARTLENGSRRSGSKRAAMRTRTRLASTLLETYSDRSWGSPTIPSLRRR